MVAYPVIKTGDTALIFRSLKDPASHPRYDGDHSSSQVLPVGFKRRPECRAFSVRTVYEKDIEVRLRDGPFSKGTYSDLKAPDLYRRFFRGVLTENRDEVGEELTERFQGSS